MDEETLETMVRLLKFLLTGLKFRPTACMFGAHGFIASYWTSEVLPVRRPCIEEEYEGLLYF